MQTSQPTTIKNLHIGEAFTLKQIGDPSDDQVWICDEYDRSEKRYLAYKWSDVSHSKLFKPDTVVFTDFVF